MKEAIVDIETTGLSPIGYASRKSEKDEGQPESEIVCIGINIGGKKAIMFNCNDATDGIDKDSAVEFFPNERVMLSRFWQFLKDEEIDTLVGFNLDFDWGFLKLRSLKHRLKFEHYDKYSDRKDIRAILNSQYKAPGKLSDYAAFFGFGTDDGINGSHVPEMYKVKQFDVIIKHLDSDIEITYRIWDRLKECGVI